VRLGPLRIAGMSGIWSDPHYHMPHIERLPFSRDDKKNFYHVREIDVRKLLQVRTQVDIGISHDRPRAIEKYGYQDQLFKMKPHFERGSRDGSLGRPASEYVMDRLRPWYWFSAHMHCMFLAIKSYELPTGEATRPTGGERKVKRQSQMGMKPLPTRTRSQLEVVITSLEQWKTFGPRYERRSRKHSPHHWTHLDSQSQTLLPTQMFGFWL
jgi:hypothetical protein